MLNTLRAQWALLSFIYLFFQIASAASPTSFCKCTCFTNSTIIPLEAPGARSSDPARYLFSRIPDDADEDEKDTDDKGGKDKEDSEKDKDKGKTDDGDGRGRKEYRAKTCNDCNRQFCIELNLPICKHAGMDDVFTTCFQRDSRKDETVVFIFIAATVGLLAWAAVKPWVGKWVEAAKERRSYAPVSGGDT